MLPRLEYSEVNTAHCSLNLLGSSDPPTSASWVAGTTGVGYHAQLVFVFFIDMGFHHVAQLVSNSWAQAISPTSASQSVGITGLSHHARLIMVKFSSCNRHYMATKIKIFTNMLFADPF